MQISPMETICIKRQILFSGKNINLSSAELSQRMVKDKCVYIYIYIYIYMVQNLTFYIIFIFFLFQNFLQIFTTILRVYINIRALSKLNHKFSFLDIICIYLFITIFIYLLDLYQ